MYKNSNPKQSDQTARPDKYPQGRFRRKPCRWCGGEFSPKAPSHLFCSQQCADSRRVERYVTKTYGISYDEYMELRQQHGDQCAICQGEGFSMMPGANKLVIDHDHKSGAVRGLLCHNCNRALGLLQDDPEVAEAAVDYLRRCNDHPERE